MSSKRKSYLQVQDEKQNIVEHFEQVQNRTEDLVKQAKSLVSLLKKRVQVDKDHTKSVQKLSSSLLEDSQFKHMKFEGSLNAHWSSIRDQLQAEAMHLSRVASNLEQQALQPLQVFLLADLEKRFRNITQEGRKTLKDYYGARTSLLKSREKYHGSTAEWEGVLLALYREGGDSWNPTPGNKLYERETLLAKRMDEARADYEQGVMGINSMQHEVFLSQLPQMLESLRIVAENMVAVMNNALKSFSEMQQLLVKGESGKDVHRPEQFNAAEYTQSVIFASVSSDSIPPPTPYEFEEYGFKDEALMIQTRKVQYKCMSKLSPQELATRGHQFLAEGDKRRASSSGTTGNNHHLATPHGSNSHHNSTSAHNPTKGYGNPNGVNIYLVEVCLEYLHQPSALKEEGIFRVSGDASIVKSLHSDFLGGRATKEFLRHAVMEQRDPNAISGLLKLHLRENPFLSSASIQSLQNSMGDMGSLVDVVLSDLTSAELSLLTNLVELLALVVQEPWKSDNKMNPRTLGIACGLSIFPQLDPSKATAVLEHLVRNSERLQQSHSLL